MLKTWPICIFLKERLTVQHVHILHPIYPYVESSGHNTQRSVVKWALLTFLFLVTLRDVKEFKFRCVDSFSCSHFKIRNQSDPFDRVALFRREPRTLRESGMYAPFEQSLTHLFTRILYETYHEDYKKECIKIPVLFIVI